MQKFVSKFQILKYPNQLQLMWVYVKDVDYHQYCLIYINKIIDLWKMTNPKGIKITTYTQITYLVYADIKYCLQPQRMIYREQ
jgi:hypothetical protein